jgi:hypothetical protein
MCGGKIVKFYKMLVVNPVCRGVCGRCRQRWENITMNCRETDCEDMK